MFLACGFFLKNNSFNLLFQFVLTHQSVIIVVRLIRANLGTNEFGLNEVFYNHFQRVLRIGHDLLPLFLILQLHKFKNTEERKCITTWLKAEKELKP